MLTGAATSHSLGAVTTSARSYGREVQTQHWRITLDELRENFRLPEKEVAKKLGALSCLRLVDVATPEKAPASVNADHDPRESCRRVSYLFEEDLSPPWNLPLALSQGARLRSRAIFPPRTETLCTLSADGAPDKRAP